jgi:hypothetical protein
MTAVHFTAAHWGFLLAVAAILTSMVLRKGVVIPSIAGIFLVGVLFHRGDSSVLDTVIYAIQTVFKALLDAGTSLFDIMLIIALMVAMLRSLQAQGADKIMIAPFRKLIRGPRSAFIVLAIIMYVASAFFWPTPAVALVGTVLIPVAAQAGFPALAAAVVLNLAGDAMALSADPVIQGATRLSSAAAGIAPAAIYPYTLVLSVILGVVAIALGGFAIRRDMRRGTLTAPATQDVGLIPVGFDGAPAEAAGAQHSARITAVVVPIVLLGVIVLMLSRAASGPKDAIVGGAATSLLGGTAAILLVFTTITHHGHHAMDSVIVHLREGFLFSFRIFAPIIPIAGFFFLGNPAHAAAVMGQGTPGFLFDFGNYIGSHLDGNPFLLCFGMTFIGMLISLDGSGFAGLPMTGSLAGALGGHAVLKVAALAALGQVATIVSATTLVAWSFPAVAVAGVAGVPTPQMVRRNFVPCGVGLLLITIVTAIWIMR